MLAWLENASDEHLHLSALTLGELQAGVEALRGRDPRRAGEIEFWIDQVERTWNVIPMDGAAFRAWARLMHGRPDEILEDAVIAATAIVHNLVVVTRNVRDFRRLGVETLDPFS